METKKAMPATNGVAVPLDEIQRVFAVQQAFLPHLRRTTAAERIQKLKQLEQVILDNRHPLREALTADFRKAPEETDLNELFLVVQEIHHAAKHLAEWMKPEKVGTPVALLGTSATVQQEPKGMGLIISPWNYPFMLTMNPLVGAVAAGCAVMIKPSEYAMATSSLMKRLLAEVFDEHEVAVFTGDYRVSQALLALPFNHIYFTGSPPVGKIVMKAAAEHLASVTLELGGKSPTIVDSTADVEAAAQRIAYKFTNAGQACVAPDYVYVHEHAHDGFVKALKQQVKAFYGADVSQRMASPDYARLINTRHYERVMALYDDAVERGAHVEMGGTGNDFDCFIDPTILTHVPDDARILQEEIFGPLLPILPFASLDEVIEGINSRPHPLALYLFSTSPSHIDYVLNNTTAGTTCINDVMVHFGHPAIPFGGVGNSGIGKGHGYYSFLAFTNQRPIIEQKYPRTTLQQFYPPYSKRTQKLIDLLLKYL